mmetsp:Transcript_1683/g.2348  ORF Transcript_1683/g.2348 Transcript_1683/m.2348 type:complete len:199 (-) Transcript_1683:642-1238(-)
MSDSSKAGVKLPYFHRTLSPEDSALIGDITPKPIVESTGTTTSGKISNASAWNAAQTWEERDVSSWAESKLSKVLNENLSTIKVGNYSVKFASFDDVKGEAQITHIRGTARFLYEMSFCFKFSFHDTSTDKKYEGKMDVRDVINDQLDDMDISLESWSAGKAPPGTDQKNIKSFLTGSNVKKFLKEIITKFSKMHTEI